MTPSTSYENVYLEGWGGRARGGRAGLHRGVRCRGYGAGRGGREHARCVVSHHEWVSLDTFAPRPSRPARGRDGPAPAVRLASEYMGLDGVRLERDDAWRRVASGVYVPAGEWRRATADNRHLALVDAAARKHGGSATAGGELVLAGVSAALVLGLPVVGRLPKLVQCLGRAGQRRRTSLLQRRVRQEPVVVLEGSYHVTDVATTCVDLARWGGLVQGVCAMDHALRNRLCTREELDVALARLSANARGLGAARIAVRLADPLSESPGESLSRVRMWRIKCLLLITPRRVALARADVAGPNPAPGAPARDLDRGGSGSHRLLLARDRRQAPPGLGVRRRSEVPP